MWHVPNGEFLMIKKQIIHQALDEIILKNNDESTKEAVKCMIDISKRLKISIYDLMELIVNDMDRKGFIN